MHILIVDDEPLARDELGYLITKNYPASSIDEAESVTEALEKMLNQRPDLVFLDIHLTDESGFELANKFKRMKNPPQIIFATAYDEYALQAFEANAIDYILKPFEEQRIRQAIEKVTTNPKQNENEPNVTTNLAVQMEERIFIVAVADILYLSVDNGETHIVTQKRQYDTNETLSRIETKLDSQKFLRTHRSFIVNIQAIREIQPWFNHTYQITVTNGVKIPVSRSYVKRLKEHLGLK
ncbi:LytTR family transcriptional regulator DNA-binding domain-containing protein [Carnobacterium gallinarum]|uniref:LytTR family transcriptional regulator DNA-binding domain-containing protein n=1 Tax=Carnobacterium gallinarum TaxID=2749 RepID=UPI0005546125|nr:LytTR family transcriptional regulator DNA-binding domain-containing protein [Carnobacterium gallinarum]